MDGENMSFLARRLIVILYLIAPNVYAESDQRPARVGEYIVKMRAPASSPSGSQSQKAAGLAQASRKGTAMVAAMGKNIKLLRSLPETGMMQVKSDHQGQIDYLKQHPDVEFVEPNYILSTGPTEVSGMAQPPSSNDYYSQSYSAVKVTESWAIAKPYNDSTPKTIVAVIDTGLDTNHGVFKDSNGLWTNQYELNGSPGVDDDGNGYIDDVHGWNFFSRNQYVGDDNEHGTHVAGIVLGVGMDVLENPIRESRIQIMPLKFLDQNGSGATSDAIVAMTYAVNNHAKVINNSWGGGSYSRALHEAYTYAYNNNVVVISAAGNSAENIDQIPMYPAALDTPSNITVASTTDSDSLSSFSNYSAQGLVHVGAPGSSILSSVPPKGFSCSYPGCFKYMSGTSMAAPFVAGLAALVIREAPQLSAYQIKGIILGAVDARSSLNSRVQTSGRVNALKTLQAAISNVQSSFWAPSYSPDYKVESRSIASDHSGGSGGCGMVKLLESSTGGSASGFGVADFLNVLAVLVMMFIPLSYAVQLRSRKPAYIRQYSRFEVAKEMQIKIGDQVVDLISNSVSLGGFSFSKNLTLDKGQKIKVKLNSEAEVDAEIVWNRENNSYGVRFAEMTDVVKKEIESWTMGLAPSSG
jgi:subtilisin family serine protease